MAFDAAQLPAALTTETVDLEPDVMLSRQSGKVMVVHQERLVANVNDSE